MVRLIASPSPRPRALVVTKGEKSLLRHIGGDAAAAVADRHFDGVAAAGRGNHHLAPHAVVGGDRLHAVEHQVHQHLFDLDGVAAHRRQHLAVLQADGHAVQARLRLQHTQRVAGQRAHVDGRFLAAVAADQAADAAQDLPGAQPLGGDSLEGVEQRRADRTSPARKRRAPPCA